MLGGTGVICLGSWGDCVWDLDYLVIDAVVLYTMWKVGIRTVL